MDTAIHAATAQKRFICRIDDGVNHMWTASALQMHEHGNIVCDEEACVDLKLSTYQYFKDKQQLEGIVEEYLNMY